MPKDALDMAVRRLVGDVKTKVLGKHKLEVIDTVVVNDVQVNCGVFDKLRSGEWLNDDIIYVAMSISEKPDFVNYGYSVSLDKIGKTRTVVPISRPFEAIARGINRRREKREKTGVPSTASLVHFYPLNHRNKHFTLLEINDRKRVIRHYDSMADQATIDGNGEQTRVARLVEVRSPLIWRTADILTRMQEEFADLEYAYVEAVSVALPEYFRRRINASYGE